MRPIPNSVDTSVQHYTCVLLTLRALQLYVFAYTSSSVLVCVNIFLWICTTKLQLSLLHGLVHNTAHRKPVVNRILGSLLCVPFVVPLFEYVRYSHCIHHLLRTDEPTVRSVRQCMSYVCCDRTSMTLTLLHLTVVSLLTLVAPAGMLWCLVSIVLATGLHGIHLHDTSTSVSSIHYQYPDIPSSYLPGATYYIHTTSRN